jgi:Tfp pilus assembly protein PilO
MKSSDRAILLGLAIVGALAAFWFLALAPKREESAKLGDQITELRGSVDAANQAAAAAEQARRDFDANYRHLVVLGKAVPSDSDTPSLMTQIQRLSVRSKVDFRSIVLGDASGVVPAAPAPTTSSTDSTSTDSTSTTATDSTSTDSTSTDSTSTDSTSTDSSASTTTAGAPPTEASAATLPIGATVGPAGLPVMPYNLDFTGGFFQVADFFGRVDGMVHSKGKALGVGGRLLTIDGFNLAADENKGFPLLTASVSATSYVTPATEGTLAGADSAGPGSTTTSTTPTTPTDSTSTSVPSAMATP